MSRIPHPNPLLARAGHTVGQPTAAERRDGSTLPESTPRGTARAALLDDLPEMVNHEFGFSSLIVDAFSNLKFPAWIELGRVVPQDLNYELFLNGMTIEQMSADTAAIALGPATPIAWGDKWGRGAAIVIAMNVPGTSPAIASNNPNAFPVEMPFNYPGMGDAGGGVLDWTNSGGVSAGVNGVGSRRNLLFTLGWVQGSMSDTTPYTRVVPRSFGAFGKRIGEGEMLQVFLVLRKGTFTGGTVSINGHCNIQLHLGTTIGTGQFNNR